MAEPGGEVSMLAVGFGCASYVEPPLAVESLLVTLADARLALSRVKHVGTIDKIARHPSPLAVAEAAGVELTAYPPEALDAVRVPTPSDYVRGQMGTRSVAEAAALLGAGEGARLLVPKRILLGSVTIAVAEAAPRPASARRPAARAGDPAPRPASRATSARRAPAPRDGGR